MAEISIERESARINPCPKVSFASLVRWGTEPEGWYVDLPYANFDGGVNCSPLECRQLIGGPTLCQSPNHYFSGRFMVAYAGRETHLGERRLIRLPQASLRY